VEQQKKRFSSASAQTGKNVETLGSRWHSGATAIPGLKTGARFAPPQMVEKDVSPIRRKLKNSKKKKASRQSWAAEKKGKMNTPTKCGRDSLAL